MNTSLSQYSPYVLALVKVGRFAPPSSRARRQEMHDALIVFVGVYALNNPAIALFAHVRN